MKAMYIHVDGFPASKESPFYLFTLKIFIYLAMSGLSCGTRDHLSSRHAGASSLTRDGGQAPCIGSPES